MEINLKLFLVFKCQNFIECISLPSIFTSVTTTELHMKHFLLNNIQDNESMMETVKQSVSNIVFMESRGLCKRRSDQKYATDFKSSNY